VLVVKIVKYTDHIFVEHGENGGGQLRGQKKNSAAPEPNKSPSHSYIPRANWPWPGWLVRAMGQLQGSRVACSGREMEIGGQLRLVGQVPNLGG